MILKKINKNRLLQKPNAFTLIEVLCVIAITGILASLLLPTINMVRKSSLKTQTKARFYEYIFALESYFHEYGHYPYFFYDKEKINLREVGADFVKALSGLSGYPDYEKLSGHEKQKLNPKGISFYHFDREEFNEKGLIVDAFGNPNIYINVDIQGDGLLKIKGKRIAAKVGIYSQKSEKGSYEDIESWK